MPLKDALERYGLDKSLYYADSQTKHEKHDLGIIHKDRFVGVRLSDEEFQRIKKKADSRFDGNMSQYIRTKIV